MSSFHCICFCRHWTDDGNIYYVSHFHQCGVRIPTNKNELGNKHLYSAEFINSFCFGFLSKLQRLMPLAPRKLLSKCPPAHKCVVHGLSWNPTCVGGFLLCVMAIETELKRGLFMVRHDNRCEKSETNFNLFGTVKDTQNNLISLDLNIGV